MDYIVRKAPKTDISIDYIPDVVYCTKDGVDLKLQINIPRSYQFAEENRKFPCMVFVQGSAWMKQNIYFNVPQMARFALRGYVVVTVEYRHAGIAPFPAQIQDAKTAVRFLRMNAEQYCIDSDNIFLWGDSSGAHTAMGAAFSAETGEFDDGTYGDVSAAVNAVVNYNAPVNLYAMKDYESKWDHEGATSPGGQLIGGYNLTDHKELVDKTNTENLIHKDVKIPPVFIIHGDRDALVPLSQSEMLAKALKKNDKEYEFYMLEGSDHSGPSFFSEPTYDLVEAFVCRNLK